jgi:hypothetical protein
VELLLCPTARGNADEAYTGKSDTGDAPNAYRNGFFVSLLPKEGGCSRDFYVAVKMTSVAPGAPQQQLADCKMKRCHNPELLKACPRSR